MAFLKVRLDDASEVGPMDLAMVQTWFQQGLLRRDSLVQKAGTTRWIRLAEAVDVSRWPSQRGPRGGGGRALAPTRLGEETEGTGASWRHYVASAVFWLLAAAALGVAFRPDVVRPEFDDAPWTQIALSLVVLGLALVRGWRFGRRFVRLICMLAVAAAFPVAGVFAARAMRGEALLALAAVMVLALGLVLFLAPRLSKLAAAAALLIVGLGLAGTVRFARAEAGPALEVGGWSSAERRISDPELGLELAIPAGWVVLKPGNPLVPAPILPRAMLAQPRVSGYALLLSEPAPVGVLTLEHYLDDVIARRRAAATTLEEGWRRDGRLGALASRRAAARRSGQDGRFSERIAVARDEDRYFALVAWVPETGGGRALEEVEALEAAVRFSAVRGRNRTEVVQAATLELPQLTPAAIEWLIEAGGPAPAAALFRRAAAASARGMEVLGPSASQELRSLTAAALAADQRASVTDYLQRVAAGQPTPADEDERMRLLTKMATLRLGAAHRSRLEQLQEAAIRAGLAAVATGS